MAPINTATPLPLADDVCEVKTIHPQAVEAARAHLRDRDAFVELADTFAALGDPNRAKIVYSLMDHELCVCDVAAAVGITESATSQHLRVLRNLRWVRHRKEGRLVYYSLQDEHVRQLMEIGIDHATGR